MASKLKQLWSKEYFQTIITIILIVVFVVGFWYGSQFVLNTQYPMLAVASGSMCIPYGQACDGWSHPFARTLHVGDLIVVQGVSVDSIYAAPVNGDIIVYRQLHSNTLIVHRAINKTFEGGVTYVITKGDANSEADQPVPASNVIGKVIMRIPWVGHLALFMRESSSILLILAIIFLLIIVEFIIPMFTEKKPETQKTESVEELSPNRKNSPKSL
ncbi:MAG TPA: signal peptidase I [Candidatus Bathyarchaeia archaeon]|nr:signal peptidase I [Candidatus Bathyarchaeia archaeon]